ncbi:hypothetical protein CK203_087205 [Vitis vinifera]|uniref:Uncharacterized protein n=1 Tax=Vitis vinifera TaxID=29760 RepID=A0A438BRZ2_VITVI|nr:hypothetical protein CK203_087205 [Vitis vinifera]
MARTRGAKSSSPSSRKKSLGKEPVPDPVSEPSAAKSISPPVKPAPPKPRRGVTLLVPSPVPSSVPSPAPQAKPQEPQPPLPEPQIPSEIARKNRIPIAAGAGTVIQPAKRYHMEHLLTPRDFFYPRIAMDFYQSMTTKQVRDPTLIHFTIDGRHGILGARHIAEALQIPYEPSHLIILKLGPVILTGDGAHPVQRSCHTITSHWTQRRGVLLEALYKMSEGFFFGPHHLILAALLYFEEKVHKKKLQRADTIPLLFPRLLCQILEHLGYPSEPQLERKRICRELFTLDKWNNMTAYRVDQPERPQPAARRASPRHIPEGITVAAPAIPRAPPAAPASSQPSTSAESRMAIPISEYRELCRSLETLTASQSSLA